MIKALMMVGLVLIPCYEVILGIFPSVFVVAENTRVHKEILSVIIALAISLLTLYQGKVKKLENKWLFIFMFASLACITLSFKIPLVVNNINSESFWNWKPLFYALCFLLMLISIYSEEFTRKNVESILAVMCYVALFQAIYVMFQSIEFDQFFKGKSFDIIGTVVVPNRVGTFGQPTLVAPFIATMIPIALYLRKNIEALALLIAVLLTHSLVALGALAFSFVIYCLLIKPESRYLIFSLLIILFIIFIPRVNIDEESNGRFGLWKQVIAEIRDGKIIKGEKDYSFTGYGPGAYAYVFPEEYGTSFRQIHNDYLELLFNGGFLSLGLFLISILMILKTRILQVYKFSDYRKRLLAALISSFCLILVCAGGTFVFQLGANMFYIIVIFALLHNNSILKGEKKCLTSYGFQY